MLAKDIMEQNVLYVYKDTTVEEVVKILLDNKISGVPVVDDEKKVIGVVTEADLILKEKEPRLPSYIEVLWSIIYIEGVKKYEEELKKMVATTVDELMTTDVLTVSENEEAEVVAKIMVEGRVNRVPIVNDDGVLVGIISRNDMLKLLI